MKCFEVWVVVFFEHGSNMRLVYRELSCEAGLILWGSNIERPSKNMQIQQNRERGLVSPVGREEVYYTE